jgi:hypothetical protein
MPREPSEHPPRCSAIACAHTLERVGNGRFHGAAPGSIDTRATRRQVQDGSPAIARIIDACQPSLCHEPLQHAREGARVHMEDGCKVSRRHTREKADDAERQPLWSGDADVAGHTL